MKLTYEQKAIIKKQVIETVDLANAIYDIDMPYPTVEFKQLGQVAGYAILQRHGVEYNETLAAENFDVFTNTVIHEVAHLVDYKIHGTQRSKNGRRIIHGKTFKAIFIALGGNGKRCHTYNVKSTKREQHKWVNTRGQEMLLGVTRHKRAMRGRKYWIRHHDCREYTYTGETV